MTEKGHNVVNVLARRCEQHPDRIAFVSAAGERLTFGQLWKNVDSVSSGLQKAGLKAGDRTVIMVPMSIELYTVLLAVFKMGAIGVFVDPWLSKRTISELAAFSSPRAFIGVPKSHLLRLLDRRLFSIPITVSTSSPLDFLQKALPFPAGHSLSSLLTAKGDGVICPVSADTSALITFTSGSSGVPKGANRTHGFLIAQHQALHSIIPYRETDVDLSMFPVFALNNLASGITTVIPDMNFSAVSSVDAQKIFRQMTGSGVTTCTASPPLVTRLVAHLELDNTELPQLRRIVTGGAPISDSTLRSWRKSLSATEIVIAYGSTEAEPVSHLSLEERLSLGEKLRGYCMGTPVPEICARIIRIQKGPYVLGTSGWKDVEVAPGEIGELVVCGDHVCREYYNNATATLENKIVDTDGSVWHRMGDTGYMDPSGRFCLTGRVHSTIVRKGVMIHPQLAEQLVMQALGDESKKVAALGLPAPDGDEKLVIVTNARVSANFVSDSLARCGISADRVITAFDEIPVDPRHNSKIDYSRLRELIRSYL